MYDAVTASNIPTTALMVAGYVDGLYKWSAADWARFPHAAKVRIAVFSTTNDGHVLDCEQGNATPAQSVDWVLLRRAAGLDPTVYCGRNTWWDQIQGAFQARKVPEPHYWVADYSGNPAKPAIPVGAIGLQYQDTGPYDLSAVADYWPGIDPAPLPIPQEHEMILNYITGNPEVWALSGSLYWHVVDPQSLNSYKAAGVPQATITAAEHTGILAAVAKLGSTVTLDAAAATAIGSAIKFPTHVTGTETTTVSETLA
jgi:hypothetical protein